MESAAQTGSKQLKEQWEMYSQPCGQNITSHVGKMECVGFVVPDDGNDKSHPAFDEEKQLAITERAPLMQETLVPHVDMSVAEDQDTQLDEPVNVVAEACAAENVGNVKPEVMECMGLVVPYGGDDPSHPMVEEEEDQPADMKPASLMHGTMVPHVDSHQQNIDE